MMSLIAGVLANAAMAKTEELAPLIMPPLAFAAIAAVVFLTLMIVTWSFRDVANRHSDKTNARSGANSHGDSSHDAGH
jgi:heme/copper-type cytochrome/quinol oxidase subunit 2